MKVVFFFNDTATTEIYTLSLHDALPISVQQECRDRKATSAADNGVLTDGQSRRISATQGDCSPLLRLPLAEGMSLAYGVRIGLSIC